MLYGVNEVAEQFDVPITIVTDWAEEREISRVNGAYIFDDDDHAAFAEWLAAPEDEDEDEDEEDGDPDQDDDEGDGD